MVHRIKLTPYTPETVRFRNRDAFRVKIVASDGDGLPNEIFGFQRTLVDANTEEQCDEFSFVCSPYDISAYPANEPDPDQSPQFFRKATVDILVPSLTVAQEVLEDIEAQVCRLVQLLDQLDDLRVLPAVWCPSEPDDDDDSESESDSESTSDSDN